MEKAKNGQNNYCSKPKPQLLIEVYLLPFRNSEAQKRKFMSCFVKMAKKCFEVKLDVFLKYD